LEINCTVFFVTKSDNKVILILLHLVSTKSNPQLRTMTATYITHHSELSEA